ncbi:ATP-binding cassette domain-containing protein [Pseudoduganella umbonata]|uniref:ATP-binding cassette domain-containing protein n=1 Tax=Pseudoduganella umbonata TaxID=864828 RepID=A0A4P8HUS0_9BURK|nr:ATP-binding cassette domain-containing protein [Pseudoduganella umbonata]MBB3222946.1 glycine betaine/proline transport system ATP-binding protein [Pseudoduganella umbonata]QCP13066.1 ATP-binding cassette domain-containing protein [Pseudoduganella umbonata]
MTAMVTLHHVTKIYPPAPDAPAGGRAAALDGISLDVGEGEICVLMGLSGCGKSTLLRLMNGLVPSTSGQVIVGGHDLGTLSERKLQYLRRGTMAMVFQSFALFPHRSVIDNAAFGLEIAGVPKAERHRRAAEVLEQVGLAGNAKQFPHQLSGGMRQRVGLARALAVDPALLLMDEAFSALDPLTRRDMQDLLLDLQAEKRRTIVFVSHDVDEAMHLADRIALLHDGKLLQHGTPEELAASPVDEHVRRFFRGVAPALQASHALAAAAPQAAARMGALHG